MMIYAGIFSCFEATRRHSRKYSRSSGSNPGVTLLPAAEFSRFPAEPHQPKPGVPTAAADEHPGDSLSRPGRGPRVNLIEAAPAAAAATPAAERLARRFDFGAGTGALSQPISQPHASQAPHVAHFGLSPKCKQIWRCRQRFDSTKLRIM